MTRIDDALDVLNGAKYFSVVDARTGYWQIPLSEEDKVKTAFVTKDGHFEYNVMLFGLVNTPASFQRAMDLVLHGIK